MVNKIVEVGPKLYLNGFPKSGTHLLDSMAMCLMSQANEEDNWMGNLGNDGFGTDLIHIEAFPEMLDELPHRRYVKGHLGWMPDLPKSFKDNHWCKVFIYRDFRDVAVSTVYHAQKDSTGSCFPNKEFYENMEFDDVLSRIITGDENIEGLMDRWEVFAPWLDEEWVLKLDFGDVIENKAAACDLFLRYLYGRTAKYYGFKAEISEEYFDETMIKMLKKLAHPEKSPTYRNGKTGEWKSHFTKEHKQLFKESDKNNWTIRLGYENDRNW